MNKRRTKECRDATGAPNKPLDLAAPQLRAGPARVSGKALDFERAIWQPERCNGED